MPVLSAEFTGILETEKEEKNLKHLQGITNWLLLYYIGF
jgi:hypothetical protein